MLLGLRLFRRNRQGSFQAEVTDGLLAWLRERPDREWAPLLAGCLIIEERPGWFHGTSALTGLLVCMRAAMVTSCGQA